MNGAPSFLERLLEEDRVFVEPWQATAFALGAALLRDGVVSWEEWSTSLGEALRTMEDDDYYLAWLAALERVAARCGLIGNDELRARRDAWERAVLATPHGQPITLMPGS